MKQTSLQMLFTLALGGVSISGGTPLHFRDYLRLGYARFSKLVQEAGISVKTGS